MRVEGKCLPVHVGSLKKLCERANRTGVLCVQLLYSSLHKKLRIDKEHR